MYKCNSYKINNDCILYDLHDHHYSNVFEIHLKAGGYYDCRPICIRLETSKQGFCLKGPNFSQYFIIILLLCVNAFFIFL